MNYLDIGILVILVVSIISGLKAGIIKVLITLVGGIVGIVLAGRYSDTLASKLTFLPENTVGIVSFAVILIVVMIIASLLAALIKKLLSAVLLGWVNRLGGAVLGLVMGALFCGALLTMWVKYQGGNDLVTDSVIARFLLDKFPVVLGLLPSKFDSVRDFFR
jgi:membrane protein required for colicin V production